MFWEDVLLTFRRSLGRSFATLVMILVFPACSVLQSPPQTRGNKIDPGQLSQLTVGVSSKTDVVALVGTPTQKAAFDDNTWLYVTETTRARLGRTLGVFEQEVVLIKFDDHGLLSEITKSVASDGDRADIVGLTTPSPGTEASFMQQLLGNIGKFNALGAGATSNGGGSPYAGNGL
jgi:outer membrane protein assembly factor BamE (lipoprotein component of BamABCDE complex)